LCAIGFSDKVIPCGPLSAGKERVPAAQARPIVVPTRMGQTDEPIFQYISHQDYYGMSDLDAGI
jgi:hypothetical protein